MEFKTFHQVISIMLNNIYDPPGSEAAWDHYWTLVGACIPFPEPICAATDQPRATCPCESCSGGLDLDDPMGDFHGRNV